MKRIYPAALRWLSLVSVVLATRLVAQDVTVSPLAWFEPKDAPEELPVLKRTLRVEFPEELTKTPDIGWAMIDASLDDKGKVTAWVVYGSQPAYARAVELGSRDERKFKPGRRGGTPVNTRVRITIIFNPASARAKGSEATPRLLDAAVVVDPNWKKGVEDSPNPSRVEWAVLGVDAQGAVTGIKGALETMKDLLEASVRGWRFSSARRASVPVAADVRVPFILVPLPAPMGKNMVPPRVLSQRPPVYPVALLKSGLRGSVVVEFVVDSEGRVRGATVVRSLNPAFDEPALDAVRDFKFEPGRVDGRAVNTRMLQPITFSLDDTRDGGADGMEVRHKGDQARLPADLTYDTAPKTDATVLPKYPYERLRENVRGSAQVSLLIDSDGKVAFSKVVRASRPEFGLALQAGAELFEFMPALKGGQPTRAMINFEQDFQIFRSQLVPDAELEALTLERKHPERILGARDLDERLKVLVSRQPIFPRSVGAAVTQGHAVVEFLVDEQGVVRLPRVVSSSDPVFGYAAVQAVSFWRFNPPMSKGKLGVARVQLPVSFVRPADAVPAPKP